MSVTVRRVQAHEARPDDNLPGYKRTGRYTDIFVTEGGRSYYSRVPEWETSDSEGYQKAQFDRRQRPGYYRKEG